MNATTPLVKQPGFNAGPLARTGLNTPLHTPLQPPPQANQPRKVTFSNAPPPPALPNPPAAPGPAPDDDEFDDSFQFFSDDLTGLDLGDADFGMPIDFHEGLGADESSIMTDGGTGDSDVGKSSTSNQAHAPPPPNPVQQQPQPNPPSRQQQNSVQYSNPPGNANSTASRPVANSAAGMLSSLLLPGQRQQQQQQQRPPQAPSNNNNTNSGQRQAYHPPPVNADPDQRQTHHTLNRPNENHNPSAQFNNPNAGNAAQQASSSTFKRPTTPSMGGFNFPPGVVSYLSSDYVSDKILLICILTASWATCILQTDWRWRVDFDSGSEAEGGGQTVSTFFPLLATL